MSSFLHFQGQTTNTCTFLLINGSLNEDKETNLTTNHRSPRAKRFTNYALKTEMEGVRRWCIYDTQINSWILYHNILLYRLRPDDSHFYKCLNISLFLEDRMFNLKKQMRDLYFFHNIGLFNVFDFIIELMWKFIFLLWG
jgi:hypothetical protein